MSIVYLSSSLLLSLWCVNQRDFSHSARKIYDLQGTIGLRKAAMRRENVQLCYTPCLRYAEHVHCVHAENQFLFLLMGKRCWNLTETIRRKMNHIKWFLRLLLHLVEFHFLAFNSPPSLSLSLLRVKTNSGTHAIAWAKYILPNTRHQANTTQSRASERKRTYTYETNWNWTKARIFISLHGVMRCIWPKRTL